MAVDNYRVSWLAYGSNSWKRITEYCSSLKWKLSKTSCFAELSFNIPRDMRSPQVTELEIEAGDKIAVWNLTTNKKIFHGRIIKLGFDGSITCKDSGFYLKNPIYLHASKQRADKIIKSICSKAGVKCGNIKITTKLTVSYAGKNASECIQDVLDRLKDKTGKRRWVRFVDDKLTLVQFQTNAHTIKVQRMAGEAAFDCTAAATSVSGSISLENYANLVNAIANVSNKTKLYARATYESGVNRYGKLIKYTNTDSKSDAASDAKKALISAAQLDRDYKCTLFGSDEIVPGVRLKFSGSDSVDIDGEFWVTEADHSLGNPHTVTVELERCKQDYVSATMKKMNTTIATNSSGSSANGTGSKIVYTGKTVPALYTAYYPSNNGPEGGYKDAMDNYLIPTYLDKGILECAAPKSVKLKSKIQVMGTGTAKDGKVYLVADRGGAITVKNGVYHFDLLMRTASQCNQWGKRRGKALLITGQKTIVTSSGSSSGGSDMAQKVLAYGKKFMGQNLNPGFAWCAWFVTKCVRACGVPTSVVPSTKSVSEFWSFAKRHGRFHSAHSGYVPQPGDIFIEKNGHSHTGFVYKVSSDGKHYSTLEGNASNRVRSHNRSIYYGYLTGFFHPNW